MPPPPPGSADSHLVAQPTLTRLADTVHARAVARRAVIPRRAALTAGVLQLLSLAACAALSAARPYEPLWLQLATATWILWLWPLARGLHVVWRARRGTHFSVQHVAIELDRLNPAAPDVFRTALNLEVHSPQTRAALEALFASWEPRLTVPAAPRVLGPDRAGRRRRFALLAALTLAGIACALPLVSPSVFGNPGAVAGRMLLPWRALHAIPTPRLTPHSMPARMVRGDTLTVAVAVEHVPDRAPVHARIRLAGAASDGGLRYELTRDSVSRAHPEADTTNPRIRLLKFGPVIESFKIRFTARDASTKTWSVEVVPPPRLKSWRAVVIPPAYTRLPRETLEAFPSGVVVLPGTRIEWQGEADRSLHAWRVEWTGAEEGVSEGGVPHSLIAQGDGDEVRVSRMVRAAGVMRVTLVDRARNGGGRTQEGPWRVDLKEDAPPEVVLLAPTGDGELPLRLKVPLVFTATDDFGVSAVRLHHIVRDEQGGVRHQGVRDVSAWRDARDGSGGGVWDGSIRGVLPVLPEPGEMVELYVEAVDNDAVSGPKSSRSASVRLRVPTAAEVRAAAEKRERDAATSLTSALEREKKAQREIERPDRAASAEALPVATEWDVRRVLSDEPRRHLQDLGRQLESELKAVRAAQTPTVSTPPRLGAGEKKTEAHTTPQEKALAALKQEVEAMEKRLPAPSTARAPLSEQKRALETLNKDQKSLDDKLKAIKPSPKAETPADKNVRDNRSRLENELKRNLQEQEQLQAWLEEKARVEALAERRREAAAKQQQNVREDVEQALKQLQEAMEKGLENGSLSPEVLEQMDRVRDLLEEVLDEGEKERLRQEAGSEAPDTEDLQRAVREMLDRKDGLQQDLERAIRMLEAMRDVRALRELATEARALEDAQRLLSEEMTTQSADRSEKTDQKSSASEEELGAQQESLEKDLQALMKRMESVASQPSMKSLPKEAMQKSSREAREAREAMKQARDKLKQPKAGRKEAQASANLAAKKLAAAAAAMEQAMAQMDKGANQAEVRAVLEETLEFTRWLETWRGGSTTASVKAAIGVPAPQQPSDAVQILAPGPLDAQAITRVAKWLAMRMDRLAAAKPFESDVLRRTSASMAASADALSTASTAESVAVLRHHARAAARELLKWLNDGDSGSGSSEGEGQGDTDFGGGESGQSGQEGSQGMAQRMRGMSGKQMAANRMTQELLRSLMEERRPGSRGEAGQGRQGGMPGGQSGGQSGGKPGGSSGATQGQGGSASSPGGGSTGGSQSGDDPQSGSQSGSQGGSQSGEGGDDGAEGNTGSARGAAANAQQSVADALESMAESADDAGGSARALRRLAEEARALERALRGGRLDPALLQKRQEQFRTRLLEAANAAEERGQQRERRAEAYTGGIAPHAARTLPVDSLAAELKRRREEARRLPLAPEQKRRMEWYYERLLGE